MYMAIPGHHHNQAMTTDRSYTHVFRFSPTAPENLAIWNHEHESQSMYRSIIAPLSFSLLTNGRLLWLLPRPLLWPVSYWCE